MGKAISGIFGGGASTSKPKLAPLPPPPAPAPTRDDPSVSNARRQIERAAALEGRPATILTSPQGLVTSASTAKKTLLGV